MRRDPRIAFGFALLGAVLVPIVWFAAFHVTPLRNADVNVLNGFVNLYQGRLAELADAVPHVADPQPFAVIGLSLVGVALYRGRGRVALGAATILLASNLTTQVLKKIAAAARTSGDVGSISHDAWPSGHSTAAMSLALTAVLVSSLRWRPWVAAAGAIGTLAVTFLLLVAGWHFPSDVVGGYLIAGTWTAGVVGVLWWIEGGRPASSARGAPLDFSAAFVPLLAVVAGGGAVALVVALLRPQRVSAYAHEHTVFVAGACLLAAVVLCLAALMSAAMTQTRQR